MFIKLHQAKYRNDPVLIDITLLIGQIVILDDESIFKSLVNTRVRSYKVIETKEQIETLIKEEKARRKK